MEEKSVRGWAARDPSGILTPYSFTIRKTGSEDVTLKVLYCGVDHSDLHQMRDEIHIASYPLVPGHEVVGEVVELGSEVKKFKVGDLVGVGCIVGSCGDCYCCRSNLEQYCKYMVFTYNGIDKDGELTRGGFSSEKLSPEQAAPLLCAGVTAYSPLRQFVGSDKILKAGILGLGGVGHVGVLIAKAMGHHVTVISTSNKKRDEALEQLGADDFLVSSNAAEMEGAAGSLDYILDTVPAVHPLEIYLALLKVTGQLLLVGVAPKPQNVLLRKESVLCFFVPKHE